MSIVAEQITGLVLAGGRGSRMGNVDKGLQAFRGLPLARQAMLRLQPQVGSVMIVANRNLGTYRSFGVPVWPDALPGFAGPLAGFLAGLTHCETPYLATVPCDTPLFPVTLVAQLAQALDESGAEVAVARTGEQVQPVFCLMNTSLRDSLLHFTRGGGRKVDLWTARQHCIEVPFDNESAFFNANTLEELRQLEASHD